MATNQDYKNVNYDRLAIWVKKGSRDSYKQSAAKFGLSLAMLVQHGVEEYITNHSGESFTKPEKPESLSAADKKLVENFNALSPKSQKALREIISELVTKGGGDNGND